MFTISRFSWVLAIPVVLAGLLSVSTDARAAADDYMLGILSPPAVHDGILYFVHWPDTLYAFDEAANRVRWSVDLDPPLDIDTIDPSALPAPPPESMGSYILVHLGRQLWGVSKVDGRSVWHVDSLPQASWENASRSSNTMPGYYIPEGPAETHVVTLEEDQQGWFVRSRMLGDGSVDWESYLGGKPRGWWNDRDGLRVVCETSAVGGPGTITEFDVGTGETLWTTPQTDGAEFRSTFRASYQTIPLVFLLEQLPSGDFLLRSFKESTGDTYRTIDYSAGDFIEALASGDKLVFLHREGTEEQRLIEFLLYYSSLNPIRFQTIREARTDQLFPEPGIDRNLLLYGGSVYSLYDGRHVWGEELQRWLVGWAADDYYVYVWDRTGALISLDRLTGQQNWQAPFNVLPEDDVMGPNYGGASLSLTDGRLFAATPKGEIVRIDPVNGEPYPGIIRISRSADSGGLTSGEDGTPGGLSRFRWLWVSVIVLVIIGFLFVWFGSRKPDYEGRENE